jgi:prepilin-type N-terminal cleavage/methylation domain-containing protein
MTLVELLVVMAILGLVLGVSGLAFSGLRAPRESGLVRELRRARTEAIRSGRPVRARGRNTPLFLPDGRAIGPGADALTGVPLVSR